ncbi:MAG: hypothetical protein R3F62_28080 [Planctomycetota bacterium]
MPRAAPPTCAIPYGGSNVLGALGYVDAARELQVQLEAQGLTPWRRPRPRLGLERTQAEGSRSGSPPSASGCGCWGST